MIYDAYYWLIEIVPFQLLSFHSALRKSANSVSPRNCEISRIWMNSDLANSLTELLAKVKIHIAYSLLLEARKLLEIVSGKNVDRY